VSSVALEPLGADDAEQMVRLLLHVDGLPAETHDSILQRAEGNPFSSRIIRRLIDEQLIVHGGGRWHAVGASSRWRCPTPSRACFAARIDLAARDEKRAVQAAAVVGRIFWPGAVAGLLNGEADRVDDTLDRLERRDLVLSRISSSVAGERELIFKHILTRDVAYESLPRRDRPPAHAGWPSGSSTRPGSGGARWPSSWPTTSTRPATAPAPAAMRWRPRGATSRGWPSTRRTRSPPGRQSWPTTAASAPRR